MGTPFQEPRAMIDCWYPIFDGTELASCHQRGLAVEVNCPHVISLRKFGLDRYLVRLHRVKTRDEFAHVVDWYKALSARWGCTGAATLACVFRGQSQDYPVGDGVIASRPAAYRTNSMAVDYLGHESEKPLDRDWRHWARVINDVTGLENESGELFGLRDPEQPERKVAAPRSARNVGNFLTTNPQLMGLAMHYGFPTASLDVTPIADLALWFAIHRIERDSGDRIRYVPNPGKPGTTTGPSVYVYLQPRDRAEFPTIDLTAIPELLGRAHRPFVQSAWALPFTRFDTVWRGDMDAQFGLVTSPAERWPSAVIKPEFSTGDLETSRGTHSAEELFPRRDPLYEALVEAKVPRLALYE
jgi:hypothetical protein